MQVKLKIIGMQNYTWAWQAKPFETRNLIKTGEKNAFTTYDRKKMEYIWNIAFCLNWFKISTPQYELHFHTALHSTFVQNLKDSILVIVIKNTVTQNVEMSSNAMSLFSATKSQNHNTIILINNNLSTIFRWLKMHLSSYIYVQYFQDKTNYLDSYEDKKCERSRRWICQKCENT